MSTCHETWCVLGARPGTSTMILIAPAARDGVVVLTNSDASGTSELAAQLLEIVLGLPSRDQKEFTA